MHGHMHEMPWRGHGEYDQKHQALLAHIDSLHAEGCLVSLVAASAGASAALNAYVERRDHIDKVVLVCGKINRPEAVSERLYQCNPAFRPAMTQLQQTLTSLTDADKAKILSLYSPVDNVVPYKDSHIDGVREERLWSLNHPASILASISLQFGHIAQFVKS